MDSTLSSPVSSDEIAQAVDQRSVTDPRNLTNITIIEEGVSKSIGQLPTTPDQGSTDSVLSIYCGEQSGKVCGTTSSTDITGQKKRTLSETSVGEPSVAGASSKRAHNTANYRREEMSNMDSDGPMPHPASKQSSHNQNNRKRPSRSEIIDLTGSDEDENGRKAQLPPCAGMGSVVRSGNDYGPEICPSNSGPSMNMTPAMEIREPAVAHAPTATAIAIPIGRTCHSASVHVQICPHARCICHAHCMCCAHVHHPPAASGGDPCPHYHQCELHSPCPGPCPHAHPIGATPNNGLSVGSSSTQVQSPLAAGPPGSGHHYHHACGDNVITCPAAGPYPVGPMPAATSCYPQPPPVMDVHHYLRRRPEPPPVVSAATAFHQQMPHHMPPPPPPSQGQRASADTQFAPGLVVPSLPTVPLAQQRLFQRQQGQMARQREAQQRWLEEQQQRQRAYHQAAAYRSPANVGSPAMTSGPAAVPLVNPNENIATAAAAAAVAAAAATASAAFFYPTFFRAMPPQPLSIEPAAAATVITQTTVAGPPFQLLQPQEVAVERLFAPAPQTFAVSANGRAMVFHPPTINTIPSFAPYVLVDPHPHHHHHPHAQWTAGPITLRQLAEFMDLPQGATQQLIEQCTSAHHYQPPTKAVPQGEEDKCAVCLCEFERDEHVRTLPCSHLFHVECIDRWLLFNKKCPVCRLHIDRDLQQQQNSSNGGGSGATGHQRGNYPAMGSNGFPFSMHQSGRAQ